MDSYERELRDKWEKVDDTLEGSLQLSFDHPLDWFVRHTAPQNKSLVIISGSPVDIPSSKSIDTDCRKRKDGRFAITFTLTEIQQEDVFISMAADIIQFSQASTQKEALNKLLYRFNAWRKLFDHKHSSLLGIEAQKGLIGELLFLRERLELGITPSKVLDGWTGPEESDQDFTYEDGWYEIKTTGASSSSVTISSLEQLDAGSCGELVVFRVDKCGPSQPGAFTLYKLIHSILDIIKSDLSATDIFILKLGSVGYIDMKDYDKQNFVYSSKQSYIVDEAFPRICRSDVTDQIINLKYQLSLPSINPWRK